ncbi:MAG TPA: hypothetical protein VHA70_03795 [Bauldia sp.]|nr:hypothetical protein [Bauldia sp.]
MAVRALVVALMMLFSSGFVALADEAATPQPGSPLRTAILDAVRPIVQAEVGGTVEFQVYDLRVLGEWAFVTARPQRRGGAPVEWTYTRYQRWIDDGAFDEVVTALLRQTPNGWLVYEYDIGATDVVWTPWKDEFPVPPEVFPGG